MRFGSGIDGTQVIEQGTDLTKLNGHAAKFREDFALVAKIGLQSFRYPILWQDIESAPEQYSWRHTDTIMESLKQLQAAGVEIIIDLLHHTCFPRWLQRGFLDPQFVRVFHRYVKAFARRYLWVTTYLIFNEPLATTLFTGAMGVWYPYRTDGRSFARMLVNVCTSICRIGAWLRGFVPNVRLLFNDTCEFHQPLDQTSESWVNYLNVRRFLSYDLVLGKVNHGHPLYHYLKRRGIHEHELSFFQHHPARLSLLMLDYYAGHEQRWGGGGIWEWPSHEPRGFGSIALDYYHRYGLPIALGETNIRGYIHERMTWAKLILEQCEQLATLGVPIQEFHYYPLLDTRGWRGLCRDACQELDPQGLIWLDCGLNRHESEFSSNYQLLAQNRITSEHIVPYRFREDRQTELQGFLKLMKHWTNWQEFS